MIFLDHNATTPVRQEVLDAMVPHLHDQFGNASSYYQSGREARAALETARETLEKPPEEQLPESENLAAGVSGSGSSKPVKKRSPKNLLKIKSKRG